MTDSPAPQVGGRSPDYQLRLYVAGPSARSVMAISNLKRICDTHLEGRCVIEVIDLIEQPHLASTDEIVAVPTLVRRLPRPLRKIVGDLSDADRVLVGLEVASPARGSIE